MSAIGARDLSTRRAGIRCIPCQFRAPNGTPEPEPRFSKPAFKKLLKKLRSHIQAPLRIPSPEDLQKCTVSHGPSAWRETFSPSPSDFRWSLEFGQPFAVARASTIHAQQVPFASFQFQVHVVTSVASAEPAQGSCGAKMRTKSHTVGLQRACAGCWRLENRPVMHAMADLKSTFSQASKKTSTFCFESGILKPWDGRAAILCVLAPRLGHTAIFGP